MAECKNKMVILRYGLEARDACWSALNESINRTMKLKEKIKSNSHELSDTKSKKSPKFPSTPVKRPSSQASLHPISYDCELNKSPDCHSTKSVDWTITYRPNMKPMGLTFLSSDDDECDDSDSANNNKENESKNNETAEMNNSYQSDQERPVDCRIVEYDFSSAGLEKQSTPTQTIQSVNVVESTPEKTFMEIIPEVISSSSFEHCEDSTIIVNSSNDHRIASSDEKPLSKYELRIKEVDENIVLYSKSFMSVVTLFVLFRIIIFFILY